MRISGLGHDLQTADGAIAVQTPVVELEFVLKVVLLGLEIVDAEQLAIEVLEPRELREMTAHGAGLWFGRLSQWVLQHLGLLGLHSDFPI